MKAARKTTPKQPPAASAPVRALPEQIEHERGHMAKSLGCTGVCEPSSTTMTRIPRSDIDQPVETGQVVAYRDHDGDVTMRRAAGRPRVRDGGVEQGAGQLGADGVADLEAAAVEQVWAAGASRSNRVGEPPSRAEPSPSACTRRSTWTANPSGSRGWVIQHPVGARRPPIDPVERSATISSNRRAPSAGVAVVGSPSTPTSLTATTPP